MASGQTANYNLNQWDAGDKVLREEFNADNGKLDSALAALAGLVAGKAEQTALEETAAAVPKFAVGTYSGNDSASRAISVGFAPKAVFVCTQQGMTYVSTGSGYLYGGLAVSGSPVRMSYKKNSATTYTNAAVQVTSTGFTVYEAVVDDYAAVHCNLSGKVYHYLAIG